MTDGLTKQQRAALIEPNPVSNRLPDILDVVRGRGAFSARLYCSETETEQTVAGGEDRQGRLSVSARAGAWTARTSK